LLSEGLSAKLIATALEPVPLYRADGIVPSSIPMHVDPDAGATFVDTNPRNPGGWIYVRYVGRPTSRRKKEKKAFPAQFSSTSHALKIDVSPLAAFVQQ